MYDGKIIAKEIHMISLPETLTGRERKVFLCRYWYLETSQEISVKMGISQRRVRTILRKIRRKLDKQLEKEESSCPESCLHALEGGM